MLIHLIKDKSGLFIMTEVDVNTPVQRQEWDVVCGYMGIWI